MPVLQQVRGVVRTLQTSMMVLLAKIVSNVNLITLDILVKRLILDAWLGPRCASADGYITFLKIQMKTCKDGRQVKKESHIVLVFLLLTIYVWSLSHKPTIKNNYQMCLSVRCHSQDICSEVVCIEASLAEFIFSNNPCFLHILLNTFKRMHMNYQNCFSRCILF